MLLKTKFNRSAKALPVPPLYESSQIEVESVVSDPLTGDVLETKRGLSPVVKELDEKSFCSSEPAELYSIENMQNMDIKPVFASSSYIHNDLDNLPNAEHALDMINESIVESSKFDE